MLLPETIWTEEEEKSSNNSEKQMRNNINKIVKLFGIHFVVIGNGNCNCNNARKCKLALSEASFVTRVGAKCD